MKSINRVLISGNLTRDPEEFTSGCRLGVAVNERVKKGDEWQDYASFFDVTVFGKSAEACAKYLSKGSPVAVDGRLRQDRWTNDSGDKRSAVKVIAQDVVFLSSGDKRDGDSGDSADAPGKTDDDDIPFARPRIADRETRRRDLFVGDGRWVI